MKRSGVRFPVPAPLYKPCRIASLCDSNRLPGTTADSFRSRPLLRLLADTGPASGTARPPLHTKLLRPQTDRSSLRRIRRTGGGTWFPSKYPPAGQLLPPPSFGSNSGLNGDPLGFPTRWLFWKPPDQFRGAPVVMSKQFLRLATTAFTDASGSNPPEPRCLKWVPGAQSTSMPVAPPHRDPVCSPKGRLPLIDGEAIQWCEKAYSMDISALHRTAGVTRDPVCGPTGGCNSAAPCKTEI